MYISFTTRGYIYFFIYQSESTPSLCSILYVHEINSIDEGSMDCIISSENFKSFDELLMWWCSCYGNGYKVLVQKILEKILMNLWKFVTFINISPCKNFCAVQYYETLVVAHSRNSNRMYTKNHIRKITFTYLKILSGFPL